MALVFSLKPLNQPRTVKPVSLDNFYMKGWNGSAVILIHGLTGTPNEMRYLARSLARKGYTVFCPRLAHHGQPLSILKRTRWQEFYQSVREAFLWIESENEGGPIFVTGLCMGALLAFLLASEFQGRISGISSLAATLFYDGWNMRWYRHLLPLGYATPLKHFFYFREDYPYGIKDKTIRARVHQFYSKARLEDLDGVAECGYPFLPVTLLHQHHLLTRHLLERLPSIRVPVQLIQAREDDTTSVRNSQFLYDRLPHKNKEMILLENSYHMITLDKERNAVAEKTDEFFTRIRLCGNQPSETSAMPATMSDVPTSRVQLMDSLKNK